MKQLRKTAVVGAATVIITFFNLKLLELGTRNNFDDT